MLAARAAEIVRIIFFFSFLSFPFSFSLGIQLDINLNTASNPKQSTNHMCQDYIHGI